MAGVMALVDGTDGDRTGIRHDHEDDKRYPAFSEIYVSKTSGRSSGGGIHSYESDRQCAGVGMGVYTGGTESHGAAAELESGRRGTNVSVASNEMCTFLILNISSLQLIPVNMIAYRSQYGSANPAVIIAPALVATLFSTIISVIYCKWKDR